MKFKLNQKVIVKVAEPWDFTSPEGDNTFTATILNEVIVSKQVSYLMKVTLPFTLGSISVSYVLTSSRNEFNNAYNICYVPNDLVADLESLSSNTDRLKFIVIGHIE